MRDEARRGEARRDGRGEEETGEAKEQTPSLGLNSAIETCAQRS